LTIYCLYDKIKEDKFGGWIIVIQLSRISDIRRREVIMKKILLFFVIFVAMLDGVAAGTNTTAAAMPQWAVRTNTAPAKAPVVVKRVKARSRDKVPVYGPDAPVNTNLLAVATPPPPRPAAPVVTQVALKAYDPTVHPWGTGEAPAATYTPPTQGTPAGEAFILGPNPKPAEPAVVVVNQPGYYLYPYPASGGYRWAGFGTGWGSYSWQPHPYSFAGRDFLLGGGFSQGTYIGPTVGEIRTRTYTTGFSVGGGFGVGGGLNRGGGHHRR
jgi:hypothetical protein